MPYAHGAVQWLAADAINTTYTISGLSFQPKALKFWWMGLGSATDIASNNTTHARRGMGFASSPTVRRAVAALDHANVAANICASGLHQTAVACTVESTPAFGGLLDLNAINSDGFQLIVDAVTPVNLTVFWEAFGGEAITNVTIGEMPEPAATGDVDYTATGFVSGGTDQVVFIAGIQTNNAVNTAQRQDSSLMLGAASGPSNQIVLLGTADDGSTAPDTDGYCQTGDIMAKCAVGGGALSSRAQLTQFGTDNFRLNWLSRFTGNRRNIYMAIKGGRWAVGSTTIVAPMSDATATVTGTPAPAGIFLMSRDYAQSVAGTTEIEDRISLGCGSSPTSRRAMGHYSDDAAGSTAANSGVYLAIEYDQILAGGFDGMALDLDAILADGFRLIVDLPGFDAAAWIGYVVFGDPPPILLAASVTLAITTVADLTTEIPFNAATTLSLTTTGDLTVPTAPGGSVTDDFNRADGVLTYPWIEARPIGSNLLIVGNSIQAENDGHKLYYRDDVVPGPDQYAQARIVDVGDNLDKGPIVRITPELNGYTAIYGYETRLAKLVAGSYSEFASAAVAWAVGDIVRIEAEGTTLRVLKNGVSVLEATDADLTDGRVGVGIYNPPSLGGPILDDWEGGALGAAPAWEFLQSEHAYAFDDVHTITYPSNVQAGTLLLLVCSSFVGTNPITSIADTRGNTYTLFSLRTGFGAFLAGYWAVNASDGPNTVTITLDGVNRGLDVIALERRGNASPAPFDQTAGTNAASGSTAPNGDQTPDVTTTTDGQLVVGAIFVVSGPGTTTFAPGTSPVAFTERETGSLGGDYEMQVQDAVQAAAGTIRSTWTASTADNFHSFVATFKAFAPASAEFEASVTLGITTAGDLSTEIPLAATASATLNAAGTLTTGITLAAAPSLALTATGVLTIDVLLTAASSLVLDTMASLTTETRLAAAASASLAVSAVLTTEKHLVGAPTIAVTAAGALTTEKWLAGTALLSVETGVDLSAGSGFQAVADLQVIATGSLITAIPLTGSAGLTLTVGAGLTTTLDLRAAVTLEAISTASLTVEGLLGASAALAVGISGALETEIYLVGPVVTVQVDAAGVLTTEVQLAGSSTLVVWATGTLPASDVMLSGSVSLVITVTGSLMARIRLPIRNARWIITVETTRWITIDRAVRWLACPTHRREYDGRGGYMEIEITEGSTEPIECFLEEDGHQPTSPLSGTPELILRDVTGFETPTLGDVEILDPVLWKVKFTPDPTDFKAILGPYTARYKITNGDVTFFSPSGQADTFRVFPR